MCLINQLTVVEINTSSEIIVKAPAVPYPNHERRKLHILWKKYILFVRRCRDSHSLAKLVGRSRSRTDILFSDSYPLPVLHVFLYRQVLGLEEAVEVDMEMDVEVVGGPSLVADDAQSLAKCPEGKVVISCESTLGYLIYLSWSHQLSIKPNL